MIILDTSTKLQALLGGAPATTQPVVEVSYVDISAASIPTFGVLATTMNGSTAVDVLAAPSSGTRCVLEVRILNIDTAAITLTVRTNKSATTYLAYKAALAVGDCCMFDDQQGWFTLSSNGGIKTVQKNPGRLISVTYISLTPGATFQISPKTNAFEIELWGAGGSNSTSTTPTPNAIAYPGGAGGGHLLKYLAVASGGLTITVGSGANGSAGGDTTVVYNSVTYTAKGGTTGGTMAAGSTPLFAIPSTPAVGTNGDLNVRGYPGGAAMRNDLTSAHNLSGYGGGLFGGAPGRVTNANGTAGVALSGGSGGQSINTNSSSTGVAGGIGIAVIRQYT